MFVVTTGPQHQARLLAHQKFISPKRGHFLFIQDNLNGATSWQFKSHLFLFFTPSSLRTFEISEGAR
jgi:hypothetical protein